MPETPGRTMPFAVTRMQERPSALPGHPPRHIFDLAQPNSGIVVAQLYTDDPRMIDLLTAAHFEPHSVLTISVASLTAPRDVAPSV